MGSSSHVFVQNPFFFCLKQQRVAKKENKCCPKYSSFQAILIIWGSCELLLMLSDFCFQAQQGKIAAEEEEEIGEDSQFMMLAKKVTAKALQKNGELLVLLRV